MSLSLNYQKWNKLEVAFRWTTVSSTNDDSDIEGHINVDQQSLINLLQRNIHKKREARKANIQCLRAQIACNKVLYPRIQSIQSLLEAPDSAKPRTVYFNLLVEQLERNPSKDCPPGNDTNQLKQTYNEMLLSLLRQVGDGVHIAVKEAGVTDDQQEEKISKALAEGMREQIYVPPKPEPAQLPIAVKLDKTPMPKTKATTTKIEVLNAPQEAEDDDLDNNISKLTPSLKAFSWIPLKAFEQSFCFIQQHRDVIVLGASDSLLGATFKAQYDNKPNYSKQCIHQSLLLQYGDKIQGDGLGIFFKK
ncbi:Cdc37 N terminal kinase binding-domain-containing protein [Mycena capillaripes]|nr:Cdc37 N terminal kinase binding-domain-containing protein [Mycena capillaripes]